MQISLNGSDWQFKAFWPAVGRRTGRKEDPANWPSATVPGCVQRDLINIGELEDPYVDFNSRKAEWVSNKEWVYVKKFTPPKSINGRRVRIRFDGVDYFADFFLNGEHLGEHGNLFVPVEFDVTDKLNYGEENTLTVVLHPAPHEQAQMGWTSKVWTMKPRFCYQWDFATQLVPLGIWQDVKLLVNDDARLTDCWVRGIPSSNFKRGDAKVQLEIEAMSEMDAAVGIDLSFNGSPVGMAKRQLSLKPGRNVVKLNIRVPDVQLWWPNGGGEQNTYEANVRMLDTSGNLLDEKQLNFGFKQVRLLHNPGVPDHVPPFCFEVNGKPTYIKGWNWVPVDHMYGGDHSAKYRRLLQLAKDANVNLIRIWGGGLIETELFYRLCDEYGLMVWQEFTLSSSGHESFPSTRPEYINMLKQSAQKIVPLRRNHASLSIWCGGNELTWTGSEDKAMRTLHSVCSKLDPDRPYVATSPLSAASDETPEKDHHGHWQYCGLEPHYPLYNNLKTVFHSEFGCEGAANLENIPRFIKDANLWPPSKTEGIWPHRGEWWVNYKQLCGFFGEIPDLPTLVRFSQFIQWEGLRYTVESNRRRKPGCGGSIPWQFNEPWPNLSCTNSVDWFATPKMAYYAVANAYAPVNISANYEKLAWKPGETFAAGLWVCNSLDSLTDCEITATITDIRGKVLAEKRLRADCAGNCATETGAIRWDIPQGFEDLFILTLRLSETEAENVYVFSSVPEPALSPMASLPETSVSAEVIGRSGNSRTMRVTNSGNAYAMFVRLRPKDLDADIYFDRNYLMIPPGKSRDVSVTLKSGGEEILCQGWNTNSISL